MPPPEPPRVKLGRMTTGKPILPAKARPSRDVADQLRLGHVEADLVHRVFEEQAVFGFLDGFELGADEFDAVLLEDAGVGEIDGEVEGGLAADGGQEGEDAVVGGHHLRFDADDFFEIDGGERLDIGAVGETRGRS